MVRPHLRYCSSVWSPYATDKIKRNEAVTICYENIVTTIMDHLKWDTLECSCTRSKLTMVFTIVNNLVHITPDWYITAGASSTKTSYLLKFKCILARTNSFKFFFLLFLSIILVWNSLPASIAEALTLVSLKGKLKKLTLWGRSH